MNYCCVCIFVLFAYILSAQENNKTVDSLLTVLKTAKADTTKVNALNQLSWELYLRGNYDTALIHAGSAKELAEKLNFRKGIAASYNNIGNVYNGQGNYPEALKNHFAALKIREEIGDKQRIASSYNNIGNVYHNQGNYPEALKNHFAALKIREEIGDKYGIATSYNNIGNVYGYQDNYHEALKNYFASLKIEEEIGDKHGIATSYGNIGLVYYSQGNYPYALKNYFTSLKIREEIRDKQGVAISYNNIGLVYDSQGNYPESLKNYFAAMKIREEIGDKQGVAISYSNIGNIYSSIGKAQEGKEWQEKALKLSKEIGYKEGVKGSYFRLANAAEALADYQHALEYHKLYSDIKDTLLDETSSKQITEMNTKYESEKKEKDIQLLTKDKELQQAEIGRQKFIRNGFVGGLIIALLLAFVIFNRFQVTRKQKKIIEYQNTQIVESINYSKRIQDSLLPSIESMQKAIPGLFIFYEPKDVVSGDFYYFKEFGNYILLACVDCTGHGVPGGFMSTLGSLLLDKIVDTENLKPSEILSKLSDEIIRVLHQQDGGELQDGMDLSVCLIDRENKRIEFSGARNGIIVVSNNEAKRYKASPLPVGGNYIKKGVPIVRNFKTESISVNSNDWIYMYTDGFIEQVGGTEGIPMNYEQFEKQLMCLSKQQYPAEKIKLLQMELGKWKGTNERTDDVLIIGYQVV